MSKQTCFFKVLIICILLFIGNTLLFHSGKASESNKIIHVDDDNINGPWDGTSIHPFQNISSAFHSALSDETIFVHQGMYYESLTIDKPIKLIGENNTETIINARDGNNIFNITADRVTIQNFTMQNTTEKKFPAISIQSDDNHISQNYFFNEEQSIIVEQSRNTIIEHNVFTDNDDMAHFPTHAIYLLSSSQCLISNNSFSLMYGYSIHLYDSYDNTIEKNRIEISAGISLSSSERNIIKSNLIRSSWFFGIKLFSNNNTIIDNTFAFCDIIINGYYDTIIENNTIDDKPLLFLRNEQDRHIENAGQIILYQCENISISKMSPKDHYIGKQGYIGIDLVSCKNCSISDCFITDKTKYGVRLDQSNKINIINNTICLSPEFRRTYRFYHMTGLYMTSCEEILISNNNISYNDRNGINCYYCTNSTISDNIIHFNSENGIHVRGSHHDFLISDNSLISNGNGIEIMGCTNSFLIHHNMVSENTYVGMQLSGSFHLNISENTVSKNNQYGIKMSTVHDSIIAKNMIDENNLSGIYIQESDENLISENKIKNQWSALICIGNNNTIACNHLRTHLSGFIIGGENNTIEQNTIKTSVFKALMLNAFDTTWDHNYWNRPRLLPKMILGLYIYFQESYWPSEPPVFIPLIDFDRNPALSPNI